MSHASHPPLNPDDLNDLWDAAVDGTLETGKHAGTAEATIIGWLQSAVPEPDPSGRSRLAAAKQTPVVTTPPETRRRTRWRWEPIASGVLAIALVVAILFAKPVRDLWQSESQRGVGSPTEQASNFVPGTGRSLISILVRPGDAESGTIQVGFWDVTVPPGMALYVPAGVQAMGNHAIAGWVEDGAVIVGASGLEHEVQAGKTTTMEPAPEYFRNGGSVDARFLLLVPFESPDAFPLRVASWPGSDGAAATPVDGPESIPHLFDAITLSAQEAVQYRVTVLAATFEPGMQFVELAPASSEQQTIHSTTVLSGEMTTGEGIVEGTPRIYQVAREGDTIQVRDDVLAPSASSSGHENLTLLTLASAPWSENPTLDQTVAPVAPFWGEWTVPASGEVNLAVRSLAIEPGGSYQLPTDAGVMYYLVEGELLATNGGAGATGSLIPGSVLVQLPETVLSFSNESGSRARLVQVLVLAGSLDEALTQEHIDRSEASVLVESSGSLPPGPASLMLEAQDYNGINDGGSSGSGGTGLTFLTPIDGVIAVRRDGGDTVVAGPGKEPYQPPLGESVEIDEGGFMLVHPGGGWAVTGADGEPGIGLVLNVQPMIAVGATPTLATPSASPPTTITFVADPGSCEVAPVTSNDLETLMATPSVAGDPTARSTRDQTGVTADPRTANEIVATMQEYADCWSTGSDALAAAYMSDQAIREIASTRGFIANDYQAGEMPLIAVAIEDIVIFPDGRAGARVVMNSEAAYVTFVMQDGRWVIDVWDDRDGGPPVNTPQTG